MIITELVLLVSFLVCVISYDAPLFMNGRPRGGFTGAPYVENPSIMKNAEEHWFTQTLDHFDDAETRTWPQRYFVNTSCFSWRRAPVFLMIGGEGALDPNWLSVGAVANYAKDYGALMFGLEHRFYGKSRPLTNTGVSSLQYLSSEQALADLATFRVAMTKKYRLDGSKWIVFGGSYSGALSAWFRFKYPHLVHGALASSAPINAVLDFPQYLEVASDSLGTDECRNNVKNASDKLEMALKTKKGLEYLSEIFETCEPLTQNINEQRQFTSSVAGNFFIIIQYNKDNRDFEGVSFGNITVDVLCGMMNNKELGNVVERYAAINNMIMKMQGAKCLDISYNKFIKFMQDTDWKSPNAEGARQWTYQTCTEFGYFQSTDSVQQVFGTTWPVSFFIQQCVDIFGPSFNETYNQRGIDWTNVNYGGYALAKSASRIIFCNGSNDPWHPLSFLKSEEEIIAIYIQGAAHCANMYPASSKDPEDLFIARYDIGKTIGMWLNYRH